MIDKCDSDIASWSPAGDNFVVKDVEKFAGTVLPQYFKHSNFSSFARQLNFYGFRKLKAEPILTADFDARTACYVRFYHEKFQKDRPELLTQIKRATKSDQQSKDDVESLKIDIMKLKECMGAMGAEHDRRMSEMSYEYNRRITALSAEYDKLAMLVQQLLSNQGVASEVPPSSAANNGVPDMMHSLSQVAAMSLQNSLRPPSLTAAAAAASGPSTYVVPHQKRRSHGDTLGAPSPSRPRFS
jgi:predicted site-specific integrase-resolvase